MYECVRHGVDFLLAGSIRDDGPLPEVITDVLDAQRQMREQIRGVTFCLMIATTLHSIAVGNLLPAWVKVVCVDINPSTVIKLTDRGSFQTVGLVTDVEPFLRALVQELDALERGMTSPMIADTDAVADSPSQPHILMCPPDYYGIEYEINPWMNRAAAGRPRRWPCGSGTVCGELLEEAGATDSTLLDPVPGLPDLVFTANAALIYRDQAVLARFRHPQRQGEEPYDEAWLAAARLRRAPACAEGVYFEGAGDALFCGDTLFAGYRIRSDVRGHQQIGAHARLPRDPAGAGRSRTTITSTRASARSRRARRSTIPQAFDDYGRAGACAESVARADRGQRRRGPRASPATPWSWARR